VPQLSDLRESGSMEQEARFVGLLHRPVYYCVNDSAKARKAEAMQMSTDEFESYTELIIAKQNEGPVGTIRLRFVKQFARFENVTSDLYSNRPEDRQAVNVQGEKG
jgi:replicative DNA helicase